jgi:hypothetical protein
MQPLPDSYSPPDPDNPESRRTPEHFTGCLLGGAVGDALGAPVEFHSIHLIHNKYGSAGITDYDVAYGRRGAIPEKWLSELELRAEIEAVAGDLFKQFEDTDAWWNRYPG